MSGEGGGGCKRSTRGYPHVFLLGEKSLKRGDGMGNEVRKVSANVVAVGIRQEQTH